VGYLTAGNYNAAIGLTADTTAKQPNKRTREVSSQSGAKVPRRATGKPRSQIASPTRGTCAGNTYSQQGRDWPLFSWSPAEDRIVRFDDKAEAESELASSPSPPTLGYGESATDCRRRGDARHQLSVRHPESCQEAPGWPCGSGGYGTGQIKPVSTRASAW
jgi:hypothetical protein